MKRAWMSVGIGCFAMLGCVGCAPAVPASAPDAAGRATTAAAIEDFDTTERAEPLLDIPTTCDAEGTFGKATLCLPAPEYTKKLCSGVYPEVALGLFGNTPFTRAYLAGDVEAWNASGGRTHRAQLAFDEEILVLAKHASSSSAGIVMTGAQASFDVLRWDGSCVSVMQGELTARKPPKALPSTIPFSRLDEGTRHALLEAPKVKKLHEALMNTCAAGVSKPCEEVERGFALAIADVVRSGVSLPVPTRRP